MQSNAFMKNTQLRKKPYTFNQRVENLFKSYFANHKNAKIACNETEINIYLKDDQNIDSASLDLKKIADLHQITFWDGYSQSEIVEVFNEKDAAKALKRFMKKLVKIINR
tara:strand:- start:1069 stop:1398 length:330 start_codon:yes stop_codon:yes gene_type:complete